jgi:Flp pilus assembly protein TadD
VLGPPTESGPSLEARIDRVAPAAEKSAPSGNPKSNAVRDLARANAENPKDPTLAMAYVRVLKSAGKRNEALAVLDAASDANPAEMLIAVEQGLLALELGQSIKAEGALQKAALGPNRDWRVLSGLGIAASSQGNQKEAQRHFAKALELSPNNPAVLNNLAVSLILDRKVDQAEAALRRAAKAGAPRQQVGQNLALIKALKSEMETDVENSPQ